MHEYHIYKAEQLWPIWVFGTLSSPLSKAWSHSWVFLYFSEKRRTQVHLAKANSDSYFCRGPSKVTSNSPAPILLVGCEMWQHFGSSRIHHLSCSLSEDNKGKFLHLISSLGKIIHENKLH